MRELTIFILRNCPYCKRALAALEELLKQEAYCDIEIELVDEQEQAERANSYDYYYVPAFYYQKVKLHEGAIDEQEVKELLDRITATDE